MAPGSRLPADLLNRLRLVVRRLRPDGALKTLGLDAHLLARVLAGAGVRAGTVLVIERAVEEAEKARRLG